MLISKILEDTLPAGSTTISFTDSDIPNSLVRIFSSKDNMYPIKRELSGSTLTITYQAQSTSTYIAVALDKSGLVIEDNLTSENSNNALSAKQGKVLKSLIKNNISDMNDVSITDIENEQVLAWDSISEKFINVNQSGGGGSTNLSELYPDDNNEHQIGTNLFIKHYTGSSVFGDTLIDSAWTDKQLINVYGYVLSTLSGYTNQVYTLNSYINGDWFAFGFQKRNEGQLRLSVGNNLHGAYEMWTVYRKVGGE